MELLAGKEILRSDRMQAVEGRIDAELRDSRLQMSETLALFGSANSVLGRVKGVSRETDTRS